MLRNLFQGFLLLTFGTLCFLVSTKTFKIQHAQFLPGKVSNLTYDEIIWPMTSCWDPSGVPMEEDIPDPNNCRQFFKCHIKDAANGPEPTVMECQTGHEGAPLYYDFMNCWCDYDDSVCYDDTNSTHRSEYFRCAREWVPGGPEEGLLQKPN